MEIRKKGKKKFLESTEGKGVYIILSNVRVANVQFFLGDAWSKFYVRHSPPKSLKNSPFWRDIAAELQSSSSLVNIIALYTAINLLYHLVVE